MYDISTQSGFMQAQTRLNQYVFLEKLGDGGMGEVWKGKHSDLDYEVAIKFLKPQFADDADLQDRFLNEGKRQARLDHPNIVRAIDFITDAGRHYLVMKYVDGVVLDKRIENAKGALPLEEAVSISLQVLSALDYAHSRGVIHRDVKPSNILIDVDDNCFLTDFGIALAVGQLRVTRTGSIIGTTYYMSPEQIKSPHDVDPSTDIYSFGVVLFEMLTGVLPFDAADGNDFLIKQAHVNTPPPKPSKLNPRLSRGVESVVLRALAKDPKDRWPNCEAMAQALEAASQTKRSLLRRTRPEGAATVPAWGENVSRPEDPKSRRLSNNPGIAEVRPKDAASLPQTWFERNRFKVTVAAGAVFVMGLLGLTAKISGWVSHSTPIVQQGPDHSAARKQNRTEPNEGQLYRQADNSIKAPEIAAGPPRISANLPDFTAPDESNATKKRPETQVKSGSLSVKQNDPPKSVKQNDPPKIVARDFGNSGTTNPLAADALRPEVKVPDIRKTDTNPGDSVPRKPLEQIATGNPPGAPPPGMRVVVSDPGATAIQRPENPGVQGAGPRPDILRPEVRQTTVPPLRPPERIAPASGTLTWSLQLKKGSVESLESRAPSSGEILTGEGLPGVPVSISLSPPGIAGVVEGPAPSNGWKTLKLRGLVNARIVISIQWKRL